MMYMHMFRLLLLAYPSVASFLQDGHFITYNLLVEATYGCDDWFIETRHTTPFEFEPMTSVPWGSFVNCLTNTCFPDLLLQIILELLFCNWHLTLSIRGERCSVIFTLELTCSLLSLWFISFHFDCQVAPMVGAETKFTASTKRDLHFTLRWRLVPVARLSWIHICHFY